jgi:long-chain fatty acid transport protein
MKTSRYFALVALAVTPGVASATDGHFLHGVGAINSAMGGVGVAGSSSLLGAFYVNPAGLRAFHGTATELGFELFKPDRTLSSSAGPASASSSPAWA